MLQGLERDDRVNGRLFERQIDCAALQEAQIFTGVGLARMLNRPLVNFYADNAEGDFREDC